MGLEINCNRATGIDEGSVAEMDTAYDTRLSRGPTLRPRKKPRILVIGVGRGLAIVFLIGNIERVGNGEYGQLLTNHSSRKGNY